MYHYFMGNVSVENTRASSNLYVCMYMYVSLILVKAVTAVPEICPYS